MARRNRTDAEVQVEGYRHYAILLDKSTSQFVVEQIAELAPVATIQEARRAIDKHIDSDNKGVRRKVIFFGDYYRGDNEARKIQHGELTSWSRTRGGRRLEGVVMSGGSRSNMDPDQIFEDTPANRAAMQRAIDFDKAEIKARRAAEKVVENEITRAEIPATFKSDG